jgi:hypothetical protein
MAALIDKGTCCWRMCPHRQNHALQKPARSLIADLRASVHPDLMPSDITARAIQRPRGKLRVPAGAGVHQHFTRRRNNRAPAHAIGACGMHGGAQLTRADTY